MVLPLQGMFIALSCPYFLSWPIFFGEMDHVGILAIIVDILSHALKLSFKDCLNIDFLVFITSCYEISQVIHVLYLNASRIT